MAVSVVLSDAPEAWELDSTGDLFEAAAELCDRGFRGDVSWARPAADSAAVWQIVLNSETVPGSAEVRAGVGDRLLLAGGVLRKLTAAEYGEVTA